MSDVFQTGVPAFITSSDSTLIVLYHSTLDPQFSDMRFKRWGSPISLSGAVSYKHKGRHAIFTVEVNISKYKSSVLLAPYDSPKNIAKQLLKYQHEDVTFFPFYNTDTQTPVQDSNGQVVKCHLESVDFNFKEKIGAKLDVAILTFRTNKFYDLSKLVRA